MKNILIRIIALFPLFILIYYARPIFAETTIKENKFRVAVVTGGHDYEKKPFNEMWTSFDFIHVSILDYQDGNCRLFDEDPSKNYDVIVFYNMNQKLDTEEQRNFLHWLEQGNKPIFLHHAISAFPTWDEFPKILGAKYFLEEGIWEGKQFPRSKYKHDVKISVSVKDSSHPLTQGIIDFEEVDEVYSQYYISPDVHVLLTTQHPESAPVLAWINTYKNAEILFIQLGHGPQIFSNEQYKKLLKNALCWAYKKNK